MINYKNKSRGMCQTLVVCMIIYTIIPTAIIFSNNSFEIIIVALELYSLVLIGFFMLYMLRSSFYCTKYDNDCIFQNLFWHKKSIKFNEIRTLILMHENICLLKEEYTKIELEKIFSNHKRKNKVRLMNNNVCISIDITNHSFINKITSQGTINYYIVDKPDSYVLKMFSDCNFINISC